MNIRKQVFLFCLFLLIITSCKEEGSKENSSVEIELKGKTTNSPLKLVFYNYAMVALDSLVIKENGIYSVKGNWEAPQMINIREAKGDPRSYVTFLSEKKVEITIDMPESQKVSPDDFEFVYQETPLSKQFLAYQQPLNKINSAADSLDREWQKLRLKYDNIPQEVRAPIDIAYKNNYRKKRTHIDNYVATHKNIITHYLYLTELRFSYNFRELEQIVAGFSEEDRKALYASVLINKLEILKKIQLGAIAPDIIKPDTAGNMLALSSLRGKYVLLDFWASWCGPCRKENPWVKKAYEKFKDKGFDVYAVSFDFPNDKNKWIAAIEEDGLSWHHVSSLEGWNDSISRIYNISGIPTPFLLSPEGKILAKGDNLREEKLIEVLSKYMKN